MTLIILEKSDEGYGIKLDDEIFIFDEEGWELFQDEFNIPENDLMVEHSKNSYYLLRRNRITDKRDYFHRVFMEKEINDFCVDNNCEPTDVDVHHKGCSADLRREKLEVKHKDKHRDMHNQNEQDFKRILEGIKKLSEDRKNKNEKIIS